MFYSSQGANSKTATQAQAIGGGALYPNLLADYSVIPMPSVEECDVKRLLPMAVELSATLSSNTSSLEKVLHNSSKGIIFEVVCKLCTVCMRICVCVAPTCFRPMGITVLNH